jgi:hypothetical protein
MTSFPILSPIRRLQQISEPVLHILGWPPHVPEQRPLNYWAQHLDQLPTFVQQSGLTVRYIQLLGLLDWEHFPERDLQCRWTRDPVPYAPFVAACLVKLDQHLPHLSQLRQFLVDQPPLLWALGFPLVVADQGPWNFDPDRSLPTARHFTRLLRFIPNAALQYLLDNSVHLIQAELQAKGCTLGQCVSLDTKHILAWVKENNPKAYVSDRFDKTQQPAGDPDCRLGCKRRHNQSTMPEPPTPYANPVPADTLAVGEFYWGYGSGIVAAKIPDYGEFVLAELTQPFDHADVSYFFPLMTTTEQRLGFRPPYAAFDAAFDAFYVYEHFAQAGGFAAVPFSERGGHKHRQFAEDGAPLCAANLPMTLKYRFIDRSTLVEHERGRYICPLLGSDTAQACPVNDPHWLKGGCISTMPSCSGARLRHTLDRHSPDYLAVYKQRTATERINSQAVELGIERPKLRNGQAIANLNTLTYVLINLRALQRLRTSATQTR